MSTLTYFVEMLHHIRADVGVKDLEFELHDPMDKASYYRITGRVNRCDAALLKDAITSLNGLEIKYFAIVGSVFDVEWFAESEDINNEFNM